MCYLSIGFSIIGLARLTSCAFQLTTGHWFVFSSTAERRMSTASLQSWRRDLLWDPPSAAGVWPAGGRRWPVRRTQRAGRTPAWGRHASAASAAASTSLLPDAPSSSSGGRGHLLSLVFKSLPLITFSKCQMCTCGQGKSAKSCCLEFENMSHGMGDCRRVGVYKTGQRKWASNSSSQNCPF